MVMSEYIEWWPAPPFLDIIILTFFYLNLNVDRYTNGDFRQFQNCRTMKPLEHDITKSYFYEDHPERCRSKSSVILET